MHPAKKILGIDYGQAKVGLAISADSLALPLKIIKNTDNLLQELGEIVTTERIDLVVVGLPLGQMGEETESSAKVRSFAKNLQKSLPVPVELFDERLTTAQTKSLGLKGNDDAHAASLILQSFIDRYGFTN